MLSVHACHLCRSNRLVLGGFFPGLSKRFLYIYPTIANDHRSGNKSYHLFGQSGALELP